MAEENSVHPNQLISWKKQFLESVVSVFRMERKYISEKAEQREIARLKEEISRKDSGSVWYGGFKNGAVSSAVERKN